MRIRHLGRLMMQNYSIKIKRTKWLICKNAWTKNIKLATLKSSDFLNIQKLREQHDKALNANKKNGTTEIIEELDKFPQTLEDKKVDVMEIGEDQDMLMKET